MSPRLSGNSEAFVSELLKKMDGDVICMLKSTSTHRYVIRRERVKLVTRTHTGWELT